MAEGHEVEEHVLIRRVQRDWPRRYRAQTADGGWKVRIGCALGLGSVLARNASRFAVGVLESRHFRKKTRFGLVESRVVHDLLFLSGQHSEPVAYTLAAVFRENKLCHNNERAPRNNLRGLNGAPQKLESIGLAPSPFFGGAVGVPQVEPLDRRQHRSQHGIVNLRGHHVPVGHPHRRCGGSCSGKESGRPKEPPPRATSSTPDATSQRKSWIETRVLLDPTKNYTHAFST